MIGGAAFPPAWVIIELGDLIETKLFIIVGSDPFRRIDRSLFQRGVDVATGDLLRNDAELPKRLSGPTTNPHLKTFEVLRGLDLLFKPSAHLAAGVTHQQTLGVVLGSEFIDQLLTVAFMKPGILLTSIDTKWRRANQRPGRVLSDVIILSAMPHFDRAILDGVEHL